MSEERSEPRGTLTTQKDQAMPTNTNTNKAAEAAEALTGAALTAAAKLAKLGEAVHQSITVGGLEHVNATIALVLELQPMLHQELEACKRANPTRDKIGAGLFHKHMLALMARGKDLSWTLDANTTFLAASFTRDARAWQAYQQRVSTSGKRPDLAQFIEFQRRFKLGHYTAKGVLTQAGKDYDAEQTELAFKAQTGKLKEWDDVDWSNFWDKDSTDEEKLATFKGLAYYFNGNALKLERKLSKSDSGRTIISRVKADLKKSIKV